jgi:hypothetical protein
MSSPGDPGPDLSLERLGARDGRRPAHLGEAALVARTQTPAGSRSDSRAAREALSDAAFTAPGAVEWLSGLRRALAALLAGKDKVPRQPAPHDAIRNAEPGPARG